MFICAIMKRIPLFFRRKTLYNQPNQAYAKHNYFDCGKYPLLAYRWFLFGNVCLLTAFLLADDTSYDQKNVGSVQALDSVYILDNLEHAAVAADHPICSKMRLDILQKGGNAIDATVTVALFLGIARHGGGAFLLIHAKETPM